MREDVDHGRGRQTTLPEVVAVLGESGGVDDAEIGALGTARIRPWLAPVVEAGPVELPGKPRATHVNGIHLLVACGVGIGIGVVGALHGRVVAVAKASRIVGGGGIAASYTHLRA